MVVRLDDQNDTALLSRLRSLLPWGLSVALHVTVLSLLTAFVFVSFTTGAKDRHIVPEARLASNEPQLPLYVPEPLLKRYMDRWDKTVDPPQATVAQEHKWQDSAKVLAQAVPIGSLNGRYELKLPSADLSAGAAARPAVKFFRSGGNAYSIVYVVDRSGSMVLTLEALKSELKRSIAQLEPMQKFHVIFFNAGDPLEIKPAKLLWATLRNKRRAYRFIDSTVSEGRTAPGNAIYRALALKPELVYFLTDGDFDPEVVQQISRWNTGGVKINTIAYTSDRGGALLGRIAAQNGGVYRFVSEDQLMR